MKKTWGFGLFLMVFTLVVGNVYAETIMSDASLSEVQRLLGQNQAKEALAMVRILLQSEPNNAEYHAWHGNILGVLANESKDMMKMAEYGMASFAAFDRAIELDPDNITGRLGRAMANFLAPPPFGNEESALADFAKVVALDEQNIEGHFYLGLLYKKRDSLDKARAEFQKVIELDSGHAEAEKELAAMGDPAQSAQKSTAATAFAGLALAITQVTVIDVTSGKGMPEMTVLITGERIEKIGKSSAIKIPPDYQVVNGRGQFLLPGFWDMHTHIIGEPSLYFPLFLANGVTGIRYMGGSIIPAEWKVLKEKITCNLVLGPRVYVGSPILDGPKPAWPGSIAVADAENGRRISAEMKSQGAEFLKVYTFLPRDAYLAIGETANKLGIPFAGHVPLLMNAFESIALGQRSMEHLDGVLAVASKRYSELEALRKAGDMQALLAGPAFKTMLEDYDESRAENLFAAMKENQVWQVPTLQAFHGLLLVREPANGRPFPESKYVPSTIKQFFGWQLPQQDQAKTKKERQYFSAWLIKAKSIVRRLQELGIPLLAGSDAPYVNCVPGFSLHEELRLLTDAGLSPLQALQTATINPARFMERTADLGTVEAGKYADLVMLAADPLLDIANTKKITAVVHNGLLLTQENLRAILAEVEGKANADK